MLIVLICKYKLGFFDIFIISCNVCNVFIILCLVCIVLIVMMLFWFLGVINVEILIFVFCLVWYFLFIDVIYLWSYIGMLFWWCVNKIKW